MFKGSIVSDSLVGCCAHHSFSANVAVGPVCLTQRTDGYTTRSGGLCEFSIADINTDMGNSVAQGIEEYQITGTQITLGYGCSNAVLCLRGARQGKSDTLEYVFGESGTIKAAGAGAPGFI